MFCSIQERQRQTVLKFRPLLRRRAPCIGWYNQCLTTLTMRPLLRKVFCLLLAVRNDRESRKSVGCLEVLRPIARPKTSDNLRASKRSKPLTLGACDFF